MSVLQMPVQCMYYGVTLTVFEYTVISQNINAFTVPVNTEDISYKITYETWMELCGEICLIF